MTASCSGAARDVFQRLAAGIVEDRIERNGVKTERHSWKFLVRQLVEKQPRRFELADILQHSNELSARYPANRFIDAKIRQSLQLLRDQGVLRFLGHGRYERTDAKPVLTTKLDPSLGDRYSNRSQIARIVVETWAEFNLYCLHCMNDALTKLPANTVVADFTCDACHARYQLKSKNGRYGPVLPGAAFAITQKAAQEGTMPDFVLVEYDLRRSVVILVDAFPGALIGETRVLPRRPLSATARRSGWRGCNIDLSGLSAVAIVEPAGIEREIVRQRWTVLAGTPET